MQLWARVEHEVHEAHSPEFAIINSHSRRANRIIVLFNASIRRTLQLDLNEAVLQQGGGTRRALFAFWVEYNMTGKRVFFRITVLFEWSPPKLSSLWKVVANDEGFKGSLVVAYMPCSSQRKQLFTRLHHWDYRIYTGEYTKESLFELRRKIWSHYWWLQLYLSSRESKPEKIQA